MIFNLTEESLEGLLEDLGVEVRGETTTDFLCMCPFHSNLDTPAFNISKETDNHLWRCWNSSCGKTGNIIDLVREMRSATPLQSMRYLKEAGARNSNLLHRKKKEPQTLEVLSESILDQYLPGNPSVLEYMLKRGFLEKTLDYFMVGTDGRDIIIPCRHTTGNLIGFTRRRTYETKQKYMDKGLPKRFTLFNIQNAVPFDVVILCEGPLDAMMIHQAGFPNAVATMMGDLTDYQADILRKYFRECIIFTDADKSGRDLGGVVAQKLKGLKMYWAQYPAGKKDAGEMSGQEIQEAISGKKSDLENKLINRRSLI